MERVVCNGMYEELEAIKTRWRRSAQLWTSGQQRCRVSTGRGLYLLALLTRVRSPCLRSGSTRSKRVRRAGGPAPRCGCAPRTCSRAFRIGADASRSRARDVPCHSFIDSMSVCDWFAIANSFIVSDDDQTRSTVNILMWIYSTYARGSDIF